MQFYRKAERAHHSLQYGTFLQIKYFLRFPTQYITAMFLWTPEKFPRWIYSPRLPRDKNESHHRTGCKITLRGAPLIGAKKECTKAKFIQASHSLCGGDIPVCKFPSKDLRGNHFMVCTKSLFTQGRFRPMTIYDNKIYAFPSVPCVLPRNHLNAPCCPTFWN
jgi:hypothetical protein